MPLFYVRLASSFLCSPSAATPYASLNSPLRRLGTTLSLSTSRTPKPPYVISYFTDVEGDLDYLDRFIDSSRVLSRESGGLVLEPGSHLVFGGDVVDRGGRDLAGAGHWCKDAIMSPRGGEAWVYDS